MIAQPKKAKLSRIHDCGEITVPFADSCAEYRDGGDLLKPTTLKTIRVSPLVGKMPCTWQMVSVEQIKLYELFSLN